MRRAQDEKVQNQQLMVQELVVRHADTQLYVVDGSDVVVKIGQNVKAVVSCYHVDDSAAGAGGLLTIAASALSVVDKDAPYGAGGDRSAIRVASVTLAANDLLVVKYISEN